ncbi:hypothetical protein CLG96_02140 [Sphingomonas oleivorans]|uniref:Uncharacterized protein n=1 Tax=Sphingomonas oleivorans TaxID=1735121 RepID=A0A2T5G1E2_9SPHN|nr:DUF1983 domain-containing protein [Sphingomonas oleivorans]PTQ12965.1 hypothetical protein CLG96_02140 [Sphingomonas oleivorans]
MKVVIDGGAVIDIGATEAAPTIGIIDYSRRETDDFGVTTVVPRGFARQMSVRVKVPTDNVDAIQRQLAALRATPAQWIADDRFDSLAVTGFYRDFSLDLAVPPVSYCTLTIEGLAEDGAFVDPGTDPAPDQRTSTLRLLQPATITDAVLISSTIPETDYPVWSNTATYALGARVIKTATHRIYESAAAGNVGNDPAGASGLWIDIGPTNRWAMFDQAIGSLSASTGSIVVTLDPLAAVNALALLDVTAASVRVQAAGYDRTQALAASPGMVTFLDLPATTGAITVTISGSGTVSAGTLLIGHLVGLGITESSPTAAITDYSRKETDDFGEVTLVERAWAKRMSVRGLIDTAAVDVVAGRIANVRATPALWIGDESLESVTVYGFFKDFSIEVGDATSTLSLSVEGLSAAAKIAPLIGDIGWSDIKDDDPAHPKPEDGATNGAPAGTQVNGRPVESITGDIDLNGENYVNLAQLADTQNAAMLARTTLNGQPIATVVTQVISQATTDRNAVAEQYSILGAKFSQNEAGISDLSQVVADSSQATSQRLTTVEARAGDLEASVQSQQGAIATLEGKTGAWWVVDVNSGQNGGRAVVSMRAENGTSSIDIAAQGIFLSNIANGMLLPALSLVGGGVVIHGTLATNTIVASANGGMRIELANNRIIFNNGSVMKVQGTGFGSSNQFVEWFGPSLANVSQCTEANAIAYLKTNGDAYFGGSLSAGVLTTKAATSDTSASAQAETAVFGSNGGTIVVTLSYTYQASFHHSFPGTSQGLNDYTSEKNLYGGQPDGLGTGHVANGADPGSCSIELYRSINGGAYALVSTLTVTGSWSWVGLEPIPAGSEPGSSDLTDSNSGSITYTDPQTVAQNRQYKAVMTSRNPKLTQNIVQRVSIIAVEE